LQSGSLEDIWCDIFVRHFINAESVAHYQNEAAQSNIVRKFADLMVLHKHGQKYTVAGIWQEKARGHEEITGGAASEVIFGPLAKPSDGGTGLRATY
jgi:hypothetical protein